MKATRILFIQWHPNQDRRILSNLKVTVVLGERGGLELPLYTLLLILIHFIKHSPGHCRCPLLVVGSQ